MGVVCQILINRTKEGFFKPGDSVPGTVKYIIDKPTEYKAVTLSLLGTGQCVWTEKTKNESRTYVGNEEYVNTTLDILQSKTEVRTLAEGTYECPFEFNLPDEIPSSHKDNICTISYCILLKFVKTKIFGRKVFSAEIPVKGYIKSPTGSTGPVIFGLEKTLTKLFSSNKPVIKLKAEVEKTYHKPEDNIEVAIHVTNNTDLIPNVRTSLYCHKLYTANCGRTNTSVEEIKECGKDLISIPPRGIANLTQTISTQPDLCCTSTKIMLVEYKVRVSVKLPMPHRNVNTEVSVIVGEMKNDEVAEASSSEVEDAPPSYWETMGDGEDKNETNKESKSS